MCGLPEAPVPWGHVIASVEAAALRCGRLAGVRPHKSKSSQGAQAWRPAPHVHPHSLDAVTVKLRQPHGRAGPPREVEVEVEAQQGVNSIHCEHLLSHWLFFFFRNTVTCK